MEGDDEKRLLSIWSDWMANQFCDIIEWILGIWAIYLVRKNNFFEYDFGLESKYLLQRS